MKVVIVQHNEKDIILLKGKVNNQFPDAQIIFFCDPMLAIKYCSQHLVDLIIAGNELKYMSGVDFLHRCEKLQPSSSGLLQKEDTLFVQYSFSDVLPFL